MARIGKLDLQAFTADRRTDEDRCPTGYEYAPDLRARRRFEKLKPVELAVHSAVRVSRRLIQLRLAGAKPASITHHPRLHALNVRCAEFFGVAPPAAYVIGADTRNACTLGTNDDAVVLVHAPLFELLDDTELLFVVGHEVGHVQ